MQNNPVDYKLPLMKSWDGRPAAFKPYQKRVKLICKSFMRRLRAAYKRGVAHAENQAYVGEAKKYKLSALTQAACEAEEDVNNLYTRSMDYLDINKLGSGIRSESWDKSDLEIANERIKSVNDAIRFMHVGTKEFEVYAYRGHSVNKGYHREETDRELALRWAKQNQEYLRKHYLEIRRSYPYIRQKYRNRLMRISIAEVLSGRKPGRITDVLLPMWELLKGGIPAADIVGPWWPRTPDIKSPKDYIDHIDKHSEIRILTQPTSARPVADYESPSVDDWLAIIGLDGGDRELRDACFQYYQRHKAAPSVKWAQERSNQLDAERSKKEIEGQIPSVKLWLEYSEEWLKRKMTAIPPLPGPEWVVLGPKDARRLCETARRDGLCVIDVVTSFVDPDTYDTDTVEEAKDMRRYKAQNSPYLEALLEHCADEGVCSLILCTDPKRRTVVGLDSKGICTSEHHCTGNGNKVDKAAWEYFRGE